MRQPPAPSGGDFGYLFGKTVGGVNVVSPKILAEELVELGWH